MKIEDIVIVGGGPAGIAAAIQLKRYGLTPLLFEMGNLGGLLRNANLVENYPGFPGGISGLDLAAQFVTQFKNHNILSRKEQVLNVEFKNRIFHIETPKGIWHSRVLIVASGTIPKQIEGLRISAQVREKVHFEVVPVLKNYGKKVLIVGAGDAAFDYALNLSKNNQVIILNRGEKRKCLPLLWECTKNNNAIEYIENTSLVSIDQVEDEQVRCVCQEQEKQKVLYVDRVLIAVGRREQIGFLSGEIREEISFIEESGCLYRIGDVKNDIYRQTSIAVGDGVMAAMKAYEHLKELNK
ncbi:MAG: NAD(P)/FAD-dependent oxidoreductase [Anaerolineaceae bacterium]|nr:NAD(P)/FAD-dependent oxidoreductase [Anaerolineaceae bacterium]